MIKCSQVAMHVEFSFAFRTLIGRPKVASVHSKSSYKLSSFRITNFIGYVSHESTNDFRFKIKFSVVDP